MKKTVSLLLVLCMLVAIAPTITFAGGVPATDDITLFPFYGDTNVLDNYKSYATFKGYYSAGLTENLIRYITYEKSGGNVEYYAENTRLSGSKYNSSCGFSSGKAVIWLENNTQYVAFKLKLTKGGTFDADTLVACASSPLVDLYLVPLSATDAAKTGDVAKAHVESVCSSATPYAKDVAIPASSDSGFAHLVYSVNADAAGEYLYIIKRVGAGNGSNVSLCVLALDATPSVLAKATLVAEKHIDIVGNSFNTTLSLTDDSGSAYLKKDYTLLYESTDTNVISVNSVTGAVTAVGAGKAKVKVTAETPDGKIYGETEEIRIVSQDILGSIVPEKSTLSLMTEDSGRVGIFGKMLTGSSADMAKYELSYRIDKPDVASVSEDGIVTARGIGTATVTVSAKAEDGNDVYTTFNVSVYSEKPNVVIDFSQTATKPDQSMPTVTPGYTIRTDVGRAITGRIFAYTDARGSLFQFGTGGGRERYLWPESKNKKDNTFAFDVEIPFESSYAIKVKGGIASTGGLYSVFIDGKHIGDHSFWNGQQGGDVTEADTEKTYNTIKLSAGKHLVEFRARKTWYDTQLGYITKMSFIPCDDVTLSSVSTNLPDELELAIGESLSGIAEAKLSNGAGFNFGINDDGEQDTENTFTASLNNDNVESTEFNAYVMADRGSTGKSLFEIVGKKEGSSELTITATVGGNVATETIAITVSDDPLADTGLRTETDELFVGDKVRLIPQPKLASGRIITSDSVTTIMSSETPDIAEVSDGYITANAIGTAKVLVKSTFNGVEKTRVCDVEILPESMVAIEVTAGGSEKIRFTDDASANPEDFKTPLFVKAISNLGKEIDISAAKISAKVLTPEYAMLDEEMNIVPVYADPENGSPAKFEVTVTLPNGRTKTVEKTLDIICAKTKATIYTKEKAETARNNIASDPDVKAQMQSSYFDVAERFVDQIDTIYSLIASEGIPRGMVVGSEGDLDMYCCRYCGTDLRAEYGSYAWIHNPISLPWKIQCPECKRIFPSNDFGSFYELGLNEYREFSREQALLNHHKKFVCADGEACTCKVPAMSEQTYADGKLNSDWYEFYGFGVKGGYLNNDRYPDVDKEVDKAGKPLVNCGRGIQTELGENASFWGVDDGFGYLTGYRYKDEAGNVKTAERHTYIAEYLHWGMWYPSSGRVANGAANYVIQKCSQAYFYSGDKRYGRVAAILLDRLADFYPYYDILPYKSIVWNSHGGLGYGKTIGSIWETFTATTYVKAYDMVYDMYDDPEVVKFLSNKSKTIKMRYAKDTPNQIRTHIEDGLLREALESLVDCSISGNFGYAQQVNAHAALILDSNPETKQWLDYLMAPGWQRSRPCLGGGLDENLINNVDGDGMGNEASYYNSYWLGELMKINKALSEAPEYASANLYNHPKYRQMFYSLANTMATNYSPNIGDSLGTMESSYWITKDQAIDAWKNLKDPLFAQVLYKVNGNTEKGLRYEITDPDYKRLEDEVADVINEYGQLEQRSNLMAHFGLAILRGGSDNSISVNATSATNTLHNTWIYFGSNYGHGHLDTLNLGMSAFGLNFMPDLGYPETTGTQPNRLQWVATTLSHNTVLINENQQALNTEIRGKIKHFDGGEAVELIDVSAPYVYNTYDSNANKCDNDLVDAKEYRRSAVSIDINDDVAYTVDFFHVIGGDTHTYSFHAASDSINSTNGLSLVGQKDDDGNYVGTLAGKSVPYGEDPNSPEAWYYKTEHPRGYTWLDHVDRDAVPEDKFEIDFAIKDFNKSIADSKGLGLHMTVLNGSNTANGAKTDVTVANGYPPKKEENKKIDFFKYVLIKNSGKNLNTTFTTVFEPYKNNRLLKSADELAVSVVDGSEGALDTHRALRIEHVSGRIDYVFYSTNNKVTLSVNDDKGNPIYFRGFVGVYSVSDGVNIYKYLHDGDILGSGIQRKSAITGTIKSFTKTLEFENEIVFKPTTALSDDEVKELKGKCLIVDNGSETRSGTFKIEGVERRGDDIALDIGAVSAIRNYVDAYNPSKGYTHIISERQSALIPLTYAEDHAPVFAGVSDKAVSAGSTIEFAVRATSDLDDETITYSISAGPRGLTIDAADGTVRWKPTASQVGKNHIAVVATDSSGRNSTVHITIEVYGSTTGSTGSESTGSAGGGGGGGGGDGGAAPNDKPDETSDGKTDTVASGENGGNEENTDSTSTENNTFRFTDLENYAWASDAINKLAADGIIKGINATTFSPSANITRADFAILLVRAFNLASDNTENFADVSATDYFAAELAIARNIGIVGGIGDNKYAPRAFITRQDMMLIICRALEKLGIELTAAEGIISAEEYADFTDIAPYAKEAVNALIGAGLVNGKNGKIAPKDYTTRAEIAVLLNRILDFTAKNK